jgi:hypothetical protein
MNVAVAPFLTRALRLNARTGRTYLLRAAIAALFLLLFAMAQGTSAFYGAPGLRLFRMVANTSAIVILLSGPAYFASVISDEKEQLTLGLLKMTGLRSFSLLTGLSAGQAVAAGSLLLVIVPFAVLSVALGGVSSLQVWAATVSLLGHLVLIASIALLCSVVCARSTRAGGATLLLLLLLFAVPPVAYGLGFRLGPQSGLKWLLWEGNSFLFRSSVFVRLQEVLSTGFSGSIIGLQPVSNAAMALVCFGLAWVLFEPCTRKTEGVAGEAAALRLPTVRRLRPGRAWRAALAWKDFHFMAGGRTMIIARTVLAGVGILAVLIYGFLRPRMRMSTEGVGVALFWFMVVFGAIECVLQAAHVLSAERRTGTLASLGTLPHSARRVVWEKAIGCAIGLLPYLAWLIVGMAMAHRLVARVAEDLLDEPMAAVAIGVVLLQFVLFLHVAALFSLLMRRGGLLVAIFVYGFGLQFGFSMLIVPFAMMGDENFVAAVSCLATAGLIVLFHWLLIRRLAHVMAE